MNMIEKVARAICDAADIDPDIIISKFQPQLIKGGGFVIPPKEYIGPAWQQFYHEAKAAIAAMREPSKEMLEEVSPHTDDWVERYWKSAIDAALKEE